MALINALAWLLDRNPELGNAKEVQTAIFLAYLQGIYKVKPSDDLKKSIKCIIDEDPDQSKPFNI